MRKGERGGVVVGIKLLSLESHTGIECKSIGCKYLILKKFESKPFEIYGLIHAFYPSNMQANI